LSPSMRACAGRTGARAGPAWPGPAGPCAGRALSPRAGPRAPPPLPARTGLGLKRYPPIPPFPSRPLSLTPVRPFAALSRSPTRPRPRPAPPSPASENSVFSGRRRTPAPEKGRRRQGTLHAGHASRVRRRGKPAAAAAAAVRVGSPCVPAGPTRPAMLGAPARALSCPSPCPGPVPFSLPPAVYIRPSSLSSAVSDRLLWMQDR
jgi:hypothetical protein